MGINKQPSPLGFQPTKANAGSNPFPTVNRERTETEKARIEQNARWLSLLEMRYLTGVAKEEDPQWDFTLLMGHTAYSMIVEAIRSSEGMACPCGKPPEQCCGTIDTKYVLNPVFSEDDALTRLLACDVVVHERMKATDWQLIPSHMAFVGDDEFWQTVNQKDAPFRFSYEAAIKSSKWRDE